MPFTAQKLAIKYCDQYRIKPNTSKWDTAVSAFVVGYDIGHNSAKPEIDRLRAESESCGAGVFDPLPQRQEWLDHLYPENPNRQQCCEAILRLYVAGAVRPEDIRRNDLLTKCVAYIDPPDIHALRKALIQPNAEDQPAP